MTSALARARSTDPHTSHEAARQASALASVHAGRIVYALRYGGPATAHELADRCRGMTQVQIARRLPEMIGSVRRVVVGLDAAGEPIYATRPGPSGRPSCVWEWVDQ